MRANWTARKLGQVCKISTGKSNVNEAVESGKYAFFDRSKTVKKSTRFLFDCEAIIIAGEGQEFLPKFYSGKFDLHQRAYALYGFDESVDIHFIYKYLIHFHKYFEEVAVGATAKSLRLRHFEDLPFPLPPLAEQKRIVAILDEAFEAIAAAKANAEKNLRNARELFDSYLQSVFANPSADWEQVTLSKIASDVTDGDHLPPPKSPTGIPFITISNINKRTREIDFSSTFTVPDEYFANLKANRKPRKGDVLYTVTGSFGIPVIVSSEAKFCFQRHIGLIRPNSYTSTRWLYYLMLSPQVFKQANDSATGTAQKTVSLKALRNFVVPKVSLEEQQAIVAKLDALSVETKKLEAIYRQKLADLDELKKSVLQKAFSGDL